MAVNFVGEDDKAPFAGAESGNGIFRYLPHVGGIALKGYVKRLEGPYHFSISLRTRKPPMTWISIPGQPMRTSWRAYIMSPVIMNSKAIPTA